MYPLHYACVMGVSLLLKTWNMDILLEILYFILNASDLKTHQSRIREILAGLSSFDNVLGRISKKGNENMFF